MVGLFSFPRLKNWGTGNWGEKRTGGRGEREGGGILG